MNLLHRQNLAADIHPVSFTLVSAHISVNAPAFVNLTDKKPALYAVPLEEKARSVLGTPRTQLDITPCRLLEAVFLLLRYI